jgi:hypothetical protein
MSISTDLSLADRFFDASIDGLLGTGLQVTRQQFMKFFSELPVNSSGTFLSNSEISSANTPTYRKITLRVTDGVYRIHPEALLERMKQRGLIQSQ